MPFIALGVIAFLTYYLAGQFLLQYRLTVNQLMLAQVCAAAVAAYLSNTYVLPMLGLSSVTQGML